MTANGPSDRAQCWTAVVDVNGCGNSDASGV